MAALVEAVERGEADYGSGDQEGVGKDALEGGGDDAKRISGPDGEVAHDGGYA